MTISDGPRQIIAALLASATFPVRFFPAGPGWAGLGWARLG